MALTLTGGGDDDCGSGSGNGSDSRAALLPVLVRCSAAVNQFSRLLVPLAQSPAVNLMHGNWTDDCDLPQTEIGL